MTEEAQRPPAPPAPEKAEEVVDEVATDSRIRGVSVLGWATLLLVGTVCAICLVEGFAAVISAAVKGRPLNEVKVPDALYQLATMALGVYIGRKTARR